MFCEVSACFKCARLKAFTANNEWWSLTCGCFPTLNLMMEMLQVSKSLDFNLFLLFRSSQQIVMLITDFRIMHTMNVYENFEVKDLCVIIKNVIAVSK